MTKLFLRLVITRRTCARKLKITNEKSTLRESAF